MKEYFVYIMTNYPRNTVLYIGVTNSLSCRAEQHVESRCQSSFTRKYNVNRVIYFETYASIQVAIAREKQLKRWSRKKKLELIYSVNPEFKDALL